MKLNLFLRTGQRVLFLLQEMETRNPDELYGRDLPDSLGGSYSSGRVPLCDFCRGQPTIRDSRFANQKCKDAIVDRIKKKIRPAP